MALNKDRPWYRWDGGWYEAKGDSTRYCVWPLDENSVILDVGAYHGDWTKRMVDKYGCAAYSFEPAPMAFGFAEKILTGNEQVRLYNLALGKENGVFPLGDAERDGAGFHKDTPPVVLVTMRDIVEVFEEEGLSHVDLASINIEGGEFDLLPYIIVSGLVNKIDRFMIQWHHVFKGAGEQMFDIQRDLFKTHKMIWNHGAWETWERK